MDRRREQAYRYGYLNSPQYTQYERVEVEGPNLIQIVPVNPGFYYVPYYNPFVVYAAPRGRAFVGGVFSFGGGIQIGAAFSPWGWGGVGFGWREHNILIDNRPWDRDWHNRENYVHILPRALSPRLLGLDWKITVIATIVLKIVTSMTVAAKNITTNITTITTTTKQISRVLAATRL